MVEFKDFMLSRNSTAVAFPRNFYNVELHLSYPSCYLLSSTFNFRSPLPLIGLYTHTFTGHLYTVHCHCRNDLAAIHGLTTISLGFFSIGIAFFFKCHFDCFFFLLSFNPDTTQHRTFDPNLPPPSKLPILPNLTVLVSGGHVSSL